MQIALLKEILKQVENGHKGVLCTLIERHGSIPRSAGAAMWVDVGGGIIGSIGGGPMEYESVKEARDMLDQGDTVRVKDFNLGAGLNENTPPESAVCGGDGKVYFEVIAPNNEVFIFGAGHIGKALSHFAALCEFHVTVWDDRPELANEKNLPWAKIICCPLEELSALSKKERLFHKNSYVVVVTRGHQLDMEALRLLDGHDVAYVGVIGSRGKKAFVDKHLKASGVSEAFLASVREPIGLPLKAEAPAEVALSIISEIVAVKNSANADALREAK